MLKKVLIIDDDANIVKVVASRLKANKYDVITANDGEDGFEKLKNGKPDLIILDIMMPRIDGYTFLKTVKTAGSLPKIPVIILTAKDKMKDLFEMEGVNDYIVKPFKAEDLLQKVDKYLRAN